MEKAEKDLQVNSAATPSSTAGNSAQLWHAPVLRVIELSAAQGDPTFNDDGLGDGLFS